MKETGLFTVRDCDVEMDKNRGFTIIPIGDVHWNADMHARSLFLEYMAELKDRMAGGESMYFVGMGDYLETFSASERAGMDPVMHASSSAWMDTVIGREITDLAKAMKHTAGRWLGFLEGNHTYINKHGVSVASLLSHMLGGGERLGAIGFIACSVKTPFGPRSMSYDIWAHHGIGAGQLAGATVNALERFARGRQGHLFIMGHDHKIAGHPGTPQLMKTRSSRGTTLQAVVPWYVRSGSWLKGYEPGKVSYIAERALPPAPIGTCEVRVVFRRRRVAGDGEKRTHHLVTQPTPRVIG